MPSRKELVSALVLAWITVLSACGGSSAGPAPPPSPNFAVQVSPSTLSLTTAGENQTTLISIVPTNGFTDNVTLSTPILPADIKGTPSFPLTIAAASITGLSSSALDMILANLCSAGVNDVFYTGGRVPTWAQGASNYSPACNYGGGGNAAPSNCSMFAQPTICGNTSYMVPAAYQNGDWVDSGGTTHAYVSPVTIGAAPILLEGP